MRSSAIAALLFFALSATLAHAAWTGPKTGEPTCGTSGATPPDCNVPAPVNVGSTQQLKSGVLGSGFFKNTGDLWFMGSSRYISFNVVAGDSTTIDANGYGIRDLAGVLQYKNSGGAWAPFAGASVWTRTAPYVYPTTITDSVGIGTPAPAQKLHVLNGNIMIEKDNPRYIERSTDADTSDRIIDIYGIGGAAQWRFYKQIKGSDTTQVYMTILSGGNVGIGKPNPGQKLDVVGNINVPTGSCYMVNGVCIGGSSGVSGTTNYVSKFTTATAVGNSQIFDNSTNVGIGTVSPGYKLAVAGDVNIVAPGTCFRVNGTCIGGGGIGPGTAGRIPRWTTTTTLGDSSIASDGVSATANGNFSVTNNLNVQSGQGSNLVFTNTGACPTCTTRTTVVGLNADFIHTNADGKGQAYIGGYWVNANGTLQLNSNVSPYTHGLGTGFNVEVGNSLIVGKGIQVGQTWIGSVVTNILFTGSGAPWNAYLVNGDLRFSDTNVSGNSNDNRVTFRAGGNVGIGTTVPGQKLEVTGNIAASGNVYAAKFIYNSDRRLKTNIEPLGDALSKLMQLQGVTYNWIDPEKGTGNQIGFIAQDVEDVVPEVVTTNEATGLKGIDYAHLAPVIVNAIKEQEAKIDAQQKEIDELKADIEALRGQ